MLLGERDDRRVDLDLGEAFDAFVLEHLLSDAAVAAADDQHFARIAVGKQRHMRHHLLIDEFVALGDLGCAVEHHHLAEERLLEQHEVLVLGLRFMEHFVDPVAHAKAEVVEQRLGNPALFGHDTPLVRVCRKKNGRVLARPLKPDSVSLAQAPCPRKISFTPTRFAENASRNTGMHWSGSAEPHMKTSSAA